MYMIHSLKSWTKRQWIRSPIILGWKTNSAGQETVGARSIAK